MGLSTFSQCGQSGDQGGNTGLSLPFTKLYGCLFVAVLEKRQTAEMSITFNSETGEHAHGAPPQACISSRLDTAATKASSCVHKYPSLVLLLQLRDTMSVKSLSK